MTNEKNAFIIIVLQLKAAHYTDVAELADAHGSGPCESNFMKVRILLPAPDKTAAFYRKSAVFFFARNTPSPIGLKDHFRSVLRVDALIAHIS